MRIARPPTMMVYFLCLLVVVVESLHTGAKQSLHVVLCHYYTYFAHQYLLLFMSADYAIH